MNYNILYPIAKSVWDCLDYSIHHTTIDYLAEGTYCLEIYRDGLTNIRSFRVLHGFRFQVIDSDCDGAPLLDFYASRKIYRCNLYPTSKNNMPNIRENFIKGKIIILEHKFL